MKITTNNSLTKLLQLLKTKLDALTSLINAKPNIDDNTPSTQAVYSSSKIEELIASGAKWYAYTNEIETHFWYENTNGTFTLTTGFSEVTSDTIPDEKIPYVIVLSGDTAESQGRKEFNKISSCYVEKTENGWSFIIAVSSKPTTKVTVTYLFFIVDEPYSMLFEDEKLLYGSVLKEPTDIDLTSLINDDIASTTSVYSSSKVDELVTSGGGSSAVTEITLGTTWSENTQAVTVEGITENDSPILTVKLSGTISEMETQRLEWSKILKADTSANTITFTTSEPTTQALTILVKGK